ncbi:hypothetical protein ACA910_008084 [Epithemia clementina (nom. ined.)]
MESIASSKDDDSKTKAENESERTQQQHRRSEETDHAKTSQSVVDSNPSSLKKPKLALSSLSTTTSTTMPTSELISTVNDLQTLKRDASKSDNRVKEDARNGALNKNSKVTTRTNPLLKVCLCHPSNFDNRTSQAKVQDQSSVEVQRREGSDSTTQNTSMIPSCRFRSGDWVYYRPRSDKETSFYGIFQCQVSEEWSQVQRYHYHPRPLPRDTDFSTKLDSANISIVETHRLVPYFTGGDDGNNDKKAKAATPTTPTLAGPALNKTTTLLIVTPNTSRYRQLALSQPMVGDVILEVGCSTGQASIILIQSGAKSWIGLDTSSEMIQTVQKLIPNSTRINSTAKKNHGQNDVKHDLKRTCQTLSYRVDALVDPVAARNMICTFAPDGPTTVFVDIGGNRALSSVLNILDFLWTQFSTQMRQIVVKSEALFHCLESRPRQTWSQMAIDGRQEWIVDNVAQWLNEQHLPLTGCLKEAESVQDATTGGISPHCFPKHPLKAPLRLSPADNETPICRYHNYHRKGCQRWMQQQRERQSANTAISLSKDKNDGNDRVVVGEYCPLDHGYCHWCLKPGHVALKCPWKRNNREAT